VARKDVVLKYGAGTVSLRIPETARPAVLSPSSLPVVADVEAAFRTVMNSPLGNVRLDAMSAPKNVAIAVPDETRPTPVKTLLPLLLDRLYRAFPGLSPDKVTIIIGGGLHPPLDDEGIRRVVPESVAPGCTVVTHDAINSPMTDFGRTTRGTPVLVNAHFGTADLKLVIGNIDPHQYVGFTGGAKGAVIACGARATITANHALMFDDHARVATIEGNPVRLDIDEAGSRIGIPLVINTVLDGSNQIVALLAGEPTAVYREGAKTCAHVYGVAISEKFDIAVASCGGLPKDINLYQAQKGLAHAAQAVKPGGKILLVAACPQGVGDDAYFDYVSRFTTPQDVITSFTKGEFTIGPHKAYLFSRTLVEFDVAVASEIPSETLARCHLAAADPQNTLERWVDGLDGSPTVACIPNANTSFFYMQAEQFDQE